MKLSIIIPTFNSSKVLGRALDSIVNQTFTDWEVLVMDGASKDNTADVAKSYGDERIKFFSEPDKGIYDAMNKGIKKSQGEWLYFLGSDDWLYDNDVFAYFFRDNDFSLYHVVYGEADASHISTYMRGEWSPEKLIFNRCHQAIFYKRKFFRRHGIYNLKYKVWADHDINLRWYLSGNVKHKLNYAKSINEDNKYDKNILALERVQPTPLEYDEIAERLRISKERAKAYKYHGMKKAKERAERYV